MADDAGSAPAGNPADAGATPGEATPPPGAAAVAAVPGAPPAVEPSASWIDGVQDPATKAWAESKGLQNGNFENVLGSYHNLEKMVGADKAGRTVVLLGDDATPEQTNTFYTKLGRPEAAKDYSVQLPEGVTDDTRLVMMRNKAHELGITDKQFVGMVEADAAYLAATQQAHTDFAATSAADATTELKKEWGAAYDLKVAGIDVAANKLGFTDTQLESLRVAMGPVDAMKFVDGLNTKMGDHDFEGGEPVLAGHKTPDQAKEEMGALSMNKEFMDAWLDKQHPGHKAAVEKKAQLARLMTGVV